jgi:hypothetical protein
MHNQTLDSAYSVNRFCKDFGIGRSLAYREIAAGRLRIRKVGRRTLIAGSDAVSWFEALPSSGHFGRR